MRFLVAAVLLLASCSYAAAQGCGSANPNCIVPTAPVGTNNNQAASTAFVQNQIGGGGSNLVSGPVSSTVPDIAAWNNTTGTLLADSGVSISVASQYQYPYGSNNTTFAAGSGLNFGSTADVLNGNNVWQGTSVYPASWTTTNPMGVGDAGSSIPSQTFSGRTFQLTFTSSQITGSPVVVTYTGVGGDTQATVATGVCNAVKANVNLVGAASGGPIVCDASAGGGAFNLQWSVLIDATLTVTSTGTGTITLAVNAGHGLTDGIAYRFGRFIPGYTTQTGDNAVANSYWFQGGEVFGFQANISNGGSSFSSVFRLSTLDAGASNIKIDVGNGITFRGPSAASCTLEGVGSLNLCAGGLYVNNIPVVVLSSSVVNGTFSGTFINGEQSASFAAQSITHTGTDQNLAVLSKVNLATGLALSVLNDAGNTNEALEVFASNTQFSLGTVNFGLSGSNVGKAVFNNASTGTITVQPTTGALGTQTLTLPDVTDTFAVLGTFGAPPAIGNVTPAAGAFTTLSASSTVSGTGFTNLFASPPAIGGSAAAAGTFTTLTATGQFVGNMANTIASATVATLDDMKVSAATTTITGNTGSPITALSKFHIGQPTFTDSSAVTVTTGATLTIDNAPAQAGSVTITNAYALNVAAGSSLFGGKVFMSGLTAGSGTKALCLNATANEVQTDTSATICGISALRYKNLISEITPEQGLGVLSLRGETYRYKPDADQDDKIHVSLIADDMAALNPACANYSPHGVENYMDRCFEAYQVAFDKKVWQEIERLKRRAAR